MCLYNDSQAMTYGEFLKGAGDYPLDPMRMAINKHAIHLVSRDTRIVRSTLGLEAGVTGACLVARSRFIGEQFEC